MAKGNEISRWIKVLGVILLLGIFSFLFSLVIGLFVSQNSTSTGNVAVISINGMIESKSVTSAFTQGAYSEDIVSDIEKASKDDMIKAVVLEINSPGGYPVASHEIVKAVKDLNKTNYAVIRDLGASGAYWIASASDKIFCDELSLTGSIGVNSAYLNFGDLLKEYNVSYERIVGGKYKDMGSPLKEMTNEEREMLQSLTDNAHEFFIKDVSENRNIPLSKMQELSEGQIFLGVEAYKKGLVDYLGGMDEALDLISKSKNITVEVVRYHKKQSFLSMLSSMMNKNSFFIGNGIGQSLINPETKSFPRIIS